MNEEEMLARLKGIPVPPISELFPAITVVVGTVAAHDRFYKLHTFSSMHRGLWTVVSPPPRGQPFISEDVIDSMLDPDNPSPPNTRQTRNDFVETPYIRLDDYDKFPLDSEYNVNAAVLGVILTALADDATDPNQHIEVELGRIKRIASQRYTDISKVAHLPDERRRLAEPALYTIIRRTL